MADPQGFVWTRRQNGDVLITHHGRRATVLRGQRAVAFLDEVVDGNEQELMARVTGNYKRGNERVAHTSTQHVTAPGTQRSDVGVLHPQSSVGDPPDSAVPAHSSGSGHELASAERHSPSASLCPSDPDAP